MIGFILTGHGEFAPGLASALELVAGRQEGFKVVPFDVEAGTVFVVPYNDLDRLEQILAGNADQIAAVVMEPVMENIGIVLPDAGYLNGVRAACDRHGVLLVFDEVKTGLTAGYAGASQRLGVTPDLIALAKSVGGGLPLAAFGGRAEVMAAVTDHRMPHFGTYNGNPLVMAAALAVDEICTEEVLAGAEQLNNDALAAMDQVITRYDLPAHTVGFGVKGAVTWSATASTCGLAVRGNAVSSSCVTGSDGIFCSM